MSRTKSVSWALVVCVLLTARGKSQTQKPGTVRSVDSSATVSRSVEPDSPATSSTAAATEQTNGTNPGTIVPRLMRFSGVLLDATGRPLSGTVDVTFALYSTEAGGEPLWFETQSVQADELGRYTALVGAMHTDGLPIDLFTSGEAHWLGIQVGLEAEQQPRVLLVSVPYALKAGDAETLGGKPASAYVLADTQNGSASATTITALTAAAAGSGKNQNTRKAKNSPLTPVCSGVTSNAGGTTNSIALFDATCDIQSSVITQSGNNIGIGTPTPGYRLDVNGSIRIPNGAGAIYMNDATNAARRVSLWSALNYIYFGDIDNSTTSALVFLSGGAGGQHFYTNGSEKVTILSGGNVGIGTASPYAQLQIGNGFGTHLGFKLVTWDSNAQEGVAIGYYLAANSIQGRCGPDGDMNCNLTLNPYGGNVGIGTPTPATALDVNGTANFSGLVTFTPGQNFGSSTSSVTGNAGTFTGDSSSGVLNSTQSGAGAAAVLNNTVGGNILVGQNNGTQEFAVDGSGNVSLSGNLNLPQTQSASEGVIYLGGLPFIHACCSESNAFVGIGAGNFNATASDNTGIGWLALASITTGGGNTAAGMTALHSNTSGVYNTATGQGALYSNTSGDDNTASGEGALNVNTTGSENVAVGEDALLHNDTGNGNTALGFCALILTYGTSFSSFTCAPPILTAGSGNTSVGALAGKSNTTGMTNTFAGYQADAGSGTLTNATALGANAVVGESNAVVLGSINGQNGATSNVNVGIGTSTPAAALQVASGDVYVSSPGSGVILKSPDGSTCRRLSIDNTGAILLSALTCP